MEHLALNDKTQPTRNGKAQNKGKAKPLRALDPRVLQDMDVSLIAVVGEGRMTVRELLDLASGSVIALDTPLDGRVELHLNGHMIAAGELVAVDDRFGVRISQIAAEPE